MLLGLLIAVRHADDARAVDAGRGRGPAGGAAHGHQRQPRRATAFAIGAGLAAVAGFLYAVQAGQINPYMGFTPVLKAFIAAVIGGFGSIAGAVLGGYVLGVLEVVLTALAGHRRHAAAGSVPPEVRDFLQQCCRARSASYRDAFVFIVLILVLLSGRRASSARTRPRGRRRERSTRAGPRRPAARHRPALASALAVLDASGQAFWQGLVDQPRHLHHPDRGLNLTSGFTGVFSLGQIGFMALGAYISAILTLPLAEKAAYLPDLPSWLAGRPPRPDGSAPFPVGFLVGDAHRRRRWSASSPGWSGGC